jgi:hypothetical protein
MVINTGGVDTETAARLIVDLVDHLKLGKSIYAGDRTLMM